MDRPFHLSGPDVSAILDGMKTQVRRMLKPQPAPNTPHDGGTQWIAQRDGLHIPVGTVGHLTVREKMGLRCPYGQPKDRLWVRETWAELIAVSPSTDEPLLIGPGERLIEPPTQWTDQNGHKRWRYDGKVIAYRANSNIEFCDGDGFRGETANRADMPRWLSPARMPRWASRLTLEVTEVRVERVQGISEADARAEGCAHTGLSGLSADEIESAVEQFARQWNEDNGKRAPWASNPWVWALTFKVVP